MEEGDYVQVRVPGERPWVTVVRVLPDGRWLGRIESDLVSSNPERRRQFAKAWFDADEPLPQLHDYKKGDLIIFERKPYEDYWAWEPSEGQSKFVPQPPEDGK